MQPPSKRERTRYNGYVYGRYPQSEHETDRKYFKRYDNINERIEYLHRRVWEDHYGSIPEGHHIHHIDGDTGNNRIENLACISGFDHLSHHGRAQGSRHEHMARIRPFASEWHRSEEGYAWHSKNAKNMWKNRQPEKRICEQCGESFDSIT